MLGIGLDPYGLTYHLGLQGKGTPGANPHGAGLEGFIAIATELKVQTLEIFDAWLADLFDTELATLSKQLKSLKMTPVISAGLNLMGPIENALCSARALGATTIRLGLSPVLEGSRNAWGAKWYELLDTIRASLQKYAPLAREQGVSFAIENRQDFSSQEQVDFCHMAGPAVGICFNTGNTFRVGEAPLDFALRVTPLVRHLHVKDYRVQFTVEGYRLVRCAIGDLPIQGIVDILKSHHTTMNAVLEPGTLEARHIRFLSPQCWHGYAPMVASTFAAALAAQRINRQGDDADFRTPLRTTGRHGISRL